MHPEGSLKVYIKRTLRIDPIETEVPAYQKVSNATGKFREVILELAVIEGGAVIEAGSALYAVVVAINFIESLLEILGCQALADV
jgi:hypothetical protein